MWISPLLNQGLVRSSETSWILWSRRSGEDIARTPTSQKPDQQDNQAGELGCQQWLILHRLNSSPFPHSPTTSTPFIVLCSNTGKSPSVQLPLADSKVIVIHFTTEDVISGNICLYVSHMQVTIFQDYAVWQSVAVMQTHPGASKMMFKKSAVCSVGCFLWHWQHLLRI